MYEDDQDIMRPGSALQRELHREFHRNVKNADSVLSLYDGQSPIEVTQDHEAIDGDEGLDKMLAELGL